MVELSSSEQITAVYVSHGDLHYTCQWRDEAGGFTCGLCSQGALGPEPKKGDSCKVCRAPVAAVRRGPPEPLFRGREEWLW